MIPFSSRKSKNSLLTNSVPLSDWIFLIFCSNLFSRSRMAPLSSLAVWLLCVMKYTREALEYSSVTVRKYCLSPLRFSGRGPHRATWRRFRVPLLVLVLVGKGSLCCLKSTHDLQVLSLRRLKASSFAGKPLTSSFLAIWTLGVWVTQASMPEFSLGV